ncbi:velvet factor [Trametes polyzona]|nr:velvet factor [Trametes polyzona]
MMNTSPTEVPPPKARAVDSSPRPAVRFSSGPLAGLTVRVELDEIQQADRGRKFARKDRRPLDPPPVVLCRAYNIIEHGTPHFREVDLPVERAALGLVCHVDLFPVPLLEESDTQPEHTSPSAAILPPMYQLYDAARPAPTAFLPGPAIGPYQAPPSQYGLTSDRAGWPPVTTDAQGHLDPDIVAFFGDYPIRESSRCTTMLWGSTFTQAEIIEYNGKRVPMFVYSVSRFLCPVSISRIPKLAQDLVVKSEGTFILRYRATNVASQMAPAPPFNVLAECYGGPFRVYATKNFPGLLPSTALTKVCLSTILRSASLCPVVRL